MWNELLGASEHEELSLGEQPPEAMLSVDGVPALQAVRKAEERERMSPQPDGSVVIRPL